MTRFLTPIYQASSIFPVNHSSALEETLITLNSENRYTSRAKMKKLACYLR